MRNLFFAILLMWILSASCSPPNPFDTTVAPVYPDTTVQINSMVPQICEVSINFTDTTSHTTAYWTDERTGRIIYKMNDQPYLNSRLHGIRFKYDEDGDTLEIAHFERGTRVDSTVYYYANGNPKQKYFYSSENDGNVEFEIQFHESGRRKTDKVRYKDGLRDGAVDYYADTDENERTETYYYRENELIGIKIYNKRYDELDRMKNRLLKAYQADSTRLANALLADGTGSKSGEVPVFYIGTERDRLYDIGTPDSWDIMDVDEAFMLKYERR